MSANKDTYLTYFVNIIPNVPNNVLMTEVSIFILLKVTTVRFISPDVTSSSQLELPVKQQISNNNSWTLLSHLLYLFIELTYDGTWLLIATSFYRRCTP